VAVLCKASLSPTAPTVSSSALPSARGIPILLQSIAPSATARTELAQPLVPLPMDAATCFALPTNLNTVVDPMA
jgi:hypothetical protein